MITQFKIFESKKDIIEDKIKNITTQLTFDYEDIGGLNINDCPFAAEAAIIGQKDQNEDIYWSLEDDDIHKMPLKEFKKIYNDLVETSKIKMLNMIKNDASLYLIWKDIINIDVPQWIIDTKKYNL